MINDGSENMKIPKGDDLKMSNDISVTVSEDNSLTSFHAVADPIITVDENEPNFFKKILNWFINSPVKPYVKKRDFND